MPKLPSLRSIIIAPFAPAAAAGAKEKTEWKKQSGLGDRHKKV
jgi:hypothetical protein